MPEKVQIQVTKRVRERLRNAKRHGQTYSEVVDNALEQYDPDEAQEDGE
jgi:hypothetical protein